MKATSKLFAILALPALATAVSVVTIATNLKDNADATVLGEGPNNTQAMVIDGDNISYFETFSAALAAWGDGTTLKLNKDVEGQIAVTTGEKTLDVNNHVLNCTTSPTISVDNAKLRIVDSCAEKTIRYYTPERRGRRYLK